MKKVLYTFNFLRNKYVLFLTVFVVWISFFDRDDLITQWDRKHELNKLETSEAFYTSEIAVTKKELAALNNDPTVLEKFAREKFYLKKMGEEIFLVDDQNGQKDTP